MKDVIFISCWYRALYIEQCINALRNARGIENKILWIVQNRRDDADWQGLVPILQKTLRSWPKDSWRFIGHRLPGWKDTQVAAWKKAYQTGADKVYFFSDDDICTPDYFEWNDAVLADGDYFGACGWKHLEDPKPYDPQKYFLVKYPTEITHGLCLKHESIPEFVAKYYASSHPAWKIVKPYTQRTYHIGYVSSNLESVGENHGPATDVLPNPIPDYGRQAVRLAE